MVVTYLVGSCADMSVFRNGDSKREEYRLRMLKNEVRQENLNRREQN